MVIPPLYRLTPRMLQSYAQIEANKILLGKLSMPKEVIENIQRKSLLKSSLFSAQIEGNTLSLLQAEQLSQTKSYAKEQREVANILQAFSFLRNMVPIHLDRDFLLTIHEVTMKALIEKERLGKLRTEPSAIFNEAGFAVYVPPPPSEIPVLLEQLIQYINSTHEQNIPIKAILSHFVFEKIHPFMDGNGRVGRLLLQAILSTGAYHFNWLLSFEEILNERKAEYYAHLDTQDPTFFIEFMLDVLRVASQQVIDSFSEKKTFDEEEVLFPRRKELLLLIREQHMMSLDAIKRRFLQVPERTLRYDLQQLQKSGFIMKVGTTRGALYKSKKE